MRTIKIFSLVFVALLFVGNAASAQGFRKALKKLVSEQKESIVSEQKEKSLSVLNGDEVKLTVSADGTSKDEATKTALRGAIEQAYGTFVSANTTILNDELVKNEIVTISTGNIKEYKEISFNEMPNGKFLVTLEAVVSISKLTSYAQSKGASTEFAGATFGMNMKMKELNKKNEEIALQNLASQVIALYPSAFSYKLSVAEPKLINSRVVNGGNYRIVLPENSLDLGLSGDYEDYYLSFFHIDIEPNQQMDEIENLILGTLSSLSLSESEIEEYKQLDLKTYSLDLSGYYPEDKIKVFFKSEKYNVINGHYYAHFRSNISIPNMDLNVSIAKILHSFNIKDNTGKISAINKWEIGFCNGNDLSLYPLLGTGHLVPWTKMSSLANGKDGSYFSHFAMKENGVCLYPNMNHFPIYRKQSKFPLLEAFFFIKKNEIQNFSNFEIISRSYDNIEIVDERKLIDFMKGIRK